MSEGSALPYRLRPNKAVDRELFLDLLLRLAPALQIQDHRYVGLGGPFLEDFRLVHARLGIDDLVCVEAEEEVHKRQLFNRPIDGVKCVHSTLEDYIDSTEFGKPVVIWFDYTEPRRIVEQIERFSRTIADVPTNSILRVTLNASPTSLGKPDQSAVESTVHEWRLMRFRERVGRLFPSDLKPEDMKSKNFGTSVLKALYLAVEGELLNLRDRCVVWALATHYADGQPMVTATLIVCGRDVATVEALVEGWGYSSKPTDPLRLDMPALSTRERLTMEFSEDAREQMGFELPRSRMRENPYKSFRQFYRFFPHFSRVEL